MSLAVAVRGAFESVLDPKDVLSDPVRCRVYECDGLTGYRVTPAPSLALTRCPLPDRLRP